MDEGSTSVVFTCFLVDETNKLIIINLFHEYQFGEWKRFLLWILKTLKKCQIMRNEQDIDKIKGKWQNDNKR